MAEAYRQRTLRDASFGVEACAAPSEGKDGRANAAVCHEGQGLHDRMTIWRCLGHLPDQRTAENVSVPAVCVQRVVAEG